MRSRVLVCIALCGAILCAFAGATFGVTGCVAVSCMAIGLLCVTALRTEVEEPKPATEATGTSEEPSLENARDAQETAIDEPAAAVTGMQDAGTSHAEPRRELPEISMC